MVYPDGSYYVGTFTNEKRNGEGKLYDSDGKLVYSGEWQDDKKHGKGILELNNETYEGDFHRDKRDGRGTIRYPDGTRFDGDFKKDMKNGEGKYFDPKGKVKKVAFFEQGE